MGRLSLFTKDSEPRLKLHATLLNSKLGRGAGPRATFDARSILAGLGDWDFGPFSAAALHLSCRLGTGPDGYYEALAQIPL